MGVKAVLLITGLVAGLGALVLSAMPAQAQRTRFQGITQCARYGSVQFSRRDTAFRRFVIERTTVQEGVHSAESVAALARRYQLDMPIALAVDAVLNQGAGVNEAIERVLAHACGLELRFRDIGA